MGGLPWPALSLHQRRRAVCVPAHPKSTAEPTDDPPRRLTPEEIDWLRETVRQREVEMQAWLGARKKQTAEE
jgi:hypothetical protein